MNTLIETFNLWGDRLVPYAVQLLWQTSLLIVLLFALDVLLSRRVRAGFRYALWMLLLVKLVLPPSLAVPTGAGFWIARSASVPAEPEPKTTATIADTSFSVSTQVTPLVQELVPVQSVPNPIDEARATPTLTRDGALFATWLAIALLLLVWMVGRWRWAAGLIRASVPAPGRLLPDGLKVPVRVLQNDLSPAVCGLLRPVILLPQSLLDRLSPDQLQTVLLHELAHIRRGDLLVNGLQTLLQIAFWWHPLLWLANARIRQVREEAVDEAVASDLGGEVDHYPATLIEVAKLTFTRPRLTLGLMGILESRSALKRRVQRLLDRPPLRSARLRWWQWTAVVAMALTLLPMAEGERVVSTSGQKSVLGIETRNEVGPTDKAPNGPRDSREATKDSLPSTAETSELAEAGVAGSEVVFDIWIAELPPADVQALGLNLKPATNDVGRFHPDDEPRAARGEWTVLDAGRYASISNVLTTTTGVDVLRFGPMRARAGFKSQFKATQIKPVVVGLTNLSYGGQSSLVEPLEVGPVLDLVPSVVGDSIINLEADFQLTQFLGYRDPAEVDLPKDTPLPLVRRLGAVNTMRLGLNEALVLGGMKTEYSVVTKSKVPMLGNVPVIGELFRDSSVSIQQKDVLVFITPIDIEVEGTPPAREGEGPARQSEPTNPESKDANRNESNYGSTHLKEPGSPRLPISAVFVVRGNRIEFIDHGLGPRVVSMDEAAALVTPNTAVVVRASKDTAFSLVRELTDALRDGGAQGVLLGDADNPQGLEWLNAPEPAGEPSAANAIAPSESEEVIVTTFRLSAGGLTASKLQFNARDGNPSALPKDAGWREVLDILGERAGLKRVEIDNSDYRNVLRPGELTYGTGGGVLIVAVKAESKKVERLKTLLYMLRTDGAQIVCEMLVVKMSRESWDKFTQLEAVWKTSDRKPSFVHVDRPESLTDWIGDEVGTTVLFGPMRVTTLERRRSVASSAPVTDNPEGLRSGFEVNYITWLDHEADGHHWVKADATITLAGTLTRDGDIVPQGTHEIESKPRSDESTVYSVNAAGYVRHAIDAEPLRIRDGHWGIIGGPAEDQTNGPIVALFINPMQIDAAGNPIRPATPPRRVDEE